jgi:hypothetical protein
MNSIGVKGIRFLAEKGQKKSPVKTELFIKAI